MDERRFIKADQHLWEVSMEDWKCGRLEVNTSLTVNCFTRQIPRPAGEGGATANQNYDRRIFHVTGAEGGKKGL
jgi:hypothetical protein